jgi:hypothetical protein
MVSCGAARGSSKPMLRPQNVRPVVTGSPGDCAPNLLAQNRGSVLQLRQLSGSLESFLPLFVSDRSRLPAKCLSHTKAHRPVASMLLGFAANTEGTLHFVEYLNEGWPPEPPSKGVRVSDNHRIRFGPCPTPVLFPAHNGELTCIPSTE